MKKLNSILMDGTSAILTKKKSGFNVILKLLTDVSLIALFHPLYDIHVQFSKADS